MFVSNFALFFKEGEKLWVMRLEIEEIERKFYGDFERSMIEKKILLWCITPVKAFMIVLMDLLHE